MTTIEPSGYEPFLSISNSTIEIPVFLGKDARTGEIKVSVTATGSPAKEAVYVLKGMVFVEQTLSDVKNFVSLYISKLLKAKILLIYQPYHHYFALVI